MGMAQSLIHSSTSWRGGVDDMNRRFATSLTPVYFEAWWGDISDRRLTRVDTLAISAPRLFKIAPKISLTARLLQIWTERGSEDVRRHHFAYR
jgi:hypothetical protein